MDRGGDDLTAGIGPYYGSAQGDCRAVHLGDSGVWIGSRQIAARWPAGAPPPPPPPELPPACAESPLYPYATAAMLPTPVATVTFSRTYFPYARTAKVELPVAVSGLLPSITQGGCCVELQMEFVTAAQLELSGEVSIWIETPENPALV